MAPVSMAISLARGYRPGGLQCWRRLPAGKVFPLHLAFFKASAEDSALTWT